MQRIVEACKSGEVPGEVVLVVSDNPEAKALDYCRKAGIPAKFIHPGEFKTKLEGEAENDYIRALREAKPDLIVLAGFMRVVKPGLIQAFHNRIINIHPSLLPKYPGLHTHERAIEAGDPEAGCTVHFVNEVVDGGKLILQARVKVQPGDTPDKLARRVLDKEHQILPAAIRMIAQGALDYDSCPDCPIQWQ
jgi:phosphoribosylglycinamide formyltransferase-1